MWERSLVECCSLTFLLLSLCMSHGDETSWEWMFLRNRQNFSLHRLFYIVSVNPESHICHYILNNVKQHQTNTVTHVTFCFESLIILADGCVKSEEFVEILLNLRSCHPHSCSALPAINKYKQRNISSHLFISSWFFSVCHRLIENVMLLFHYLLFSVPTNRTTVDDEHSDPLFVLF